MTSLADADLSQLVDEWLDWTQVGELLACDAGQGPHHDP